MRSGLVPKASQSQFIHLDLIRVPYILYCVKYIGLVSRAPLPGVSEEQPANHTFLHRFPLFSKWLAAKCLFEMCFGPGKLGAAAENTSRIHNKEGYATLHLY